jgi:hypothetical protein
VCGVGSSGFAPIEFGICFARGGFSEGAATVVTQLDSLLATASL